MIRHVVRLAARLSVVSCVLLAAGPGIARAHAPDPVISSSLWDQDERLEFRFRAGSEPPSAIRTAIRAAADDSNASQNARGAVFGYDSTGANPIGYGAGATCGVNGIACFTRSVPTGFTMWLREHGRVFDWGALRWCQLSDTTGCYDAETVALDEFGHIQVLGHHDNYSDDRDYLDAVVQTVSRTKPKAGWDEHSYGRCDVATLQREYDVPSSAELISTCLDLDTALSLAASPTSIVYNGTTTLSAVLRIVDAAAYDRLGNNTVTGRTVRLQRRPVGTTTWTTIGSMTAGPQGTYTLSVSLRSDTEFRAVFSTPSNEGLNGDTSGTVRVSVGDCSGICPLRAVP